MSLTPDEIKLIVEALRDKIVVLKEKNGTEFTQAQLTSIVKKLEQ